MINECDYSYTLSGQSHGFSIYSAIIRCYHEKIEYLDYKTFFLGY